MDRIDQEDQILKPGRYVIVQRQGYTKLHKLKQQGSIILGNFTVELDAVIGNKYQDVFQMKLKKEGKKLHVLEKVEKIITIDQINVEKSGKDNRNIKGDNTSQGLTKEEIDRMRDESASANDIVEKLIVNSKSFGLKTEYAQEKYMKKKEKKYFEYIKIRKPTVRLLAEMFYRQDPSKTLGIRIDDLSQILTYANVQSDGNYLLYDSGSSGLMAAGILDRIGACTEGKLVHMHPGNECQKSGLLGMNFPAEQFERCINVNLYSVLRCYYQNCKGSSCKGKIKEEKLTEEDIEKNLEDVKEDTKEIKAIEVDLNKEKIELEIPKNEIKIKETSKTGNKRPIDVEETRKNYFKKLKKEDHSSGQKKPGWMFENEKACSILKDKVDGLILTVKEHPISLVKELSQFLKGSRNLVVFSVLREPLQDLYVHLKCRCDFISIRVFNNFMRCYQVLPERTHPAINMNSGGYILTAVKLSN